MYSICNYAFIVGIISILFVNRFFNFIARYVPPIVKNLICNLLQMINKKYFCLTVSILNIKCGANFLTENFAEKSSVKETLSTSLQGCYYKSHGQD